MSTIDDRLNRLRTKLSKKKLTEENKYVRPTFKVISIMMDDQVKRCAICEVEFSNTIKYAVDHCHKTLKIRGLLCIPCNSGLGMFKDNIRSLERAISYLKDVRKFRR